MDIKIKGNKRCQGTQGNYVDQRNYIELIGRFRIGNEARANEQWKKEDDVELMEERNGAGKIFCKKK